MAPLPWKYSALLEDFFRSHAFYYPENEATITPGSVGYLDKDASFHELFHLVKNGGPLQALGPPVTDNTQWGPRFSQNITSRSSSLKNKYEYTGTPAFFIIDFSSFSIHGVTFDTEIKFSMASSSGALLACSDQIERVQYGRIEPFRLCAYAYAREWRERFQSEISDFYIITKTFKAPEAWALAWSSQQSSGTAHGDATVYQTASARAGSKWFVSNTTGSWNHKGDVCCTLLSVITA
jgi:hypothetical protein